MYERVKCSLKADVAFAVGFSSEIGFNSSKVFMKELTDRLTVSPSSSQISIVQFGKYTDLKVKFNSVGDVNEAVNGLTFPGKSKSIEKALRMAYEQSFNVRNGMRKDTEQILVLITDINSADSRAVKNTLSLYKEAGIKVLVIATNKLVVPRDVIGSGVEMVIVKNFDEITSEEVLDKVTIGVCHAAGMESVLLLTLPVVLLM